MAILRLSARRRVAGVAACVVILTAATAAQKTKSAVPAQPADRTIAHVLNRLAFGGVPGDIERVRRMGLANYIEQQLQPSRIADERVTAKLANLQTIAKSPQ